MSTGPSPRPPVARARLPRGLYVITDSALIEAGELEHRVSLAIDGGARAVQYRHKGRDRRRRQIEAAALRELCTRRGVVLIVNDDVELAQAVAADGVHLGRDDLPIGQARKALGAHALIGASCYDSLARARSAQQAGADYVAFGSFFVSSTKPQARRAPLTLLRRARGALALPLVAIGGITPENGAELVEAGADALAVISGVFGHDDVENAARAYAALFGPAA